VVLTNTGTQPKEVMGHNWVLLKPGTDVAAFDAAALSSKDTNYIPAALQDEIIAKIDLLGPHKSGEADFKAPMTPGEYPFLCTFPAHYQTGMKGFLTVK
jgi:azurin